MIARLELNELQCDYGDCVDGPNRPTDRLNKRRITRILNMRDAHPSLQLPLKPVFYEGHQRDIHIAEHLAI